MTSNRFTTDGKFALVEAGSSLRMPFLDVLPVYERPGALAYHSDIPNFFSESRNSWLPLAVGSGSQTPSMTDVENIGTAAGSLDVFKQYDPLQPLDKVAQLRRIAPGANITLSYVNDSIVIDNLQFPAINDIINVGTAPGSLDVFRQTVSLQIGDPVTAELRRIAAGTNVSIAYVNESIVISSFQPPDPAVVDVINIGTEAGALDVFKQMDPLQPINKIAQLRRIAPGAHTTVTYSNDCIVIDAIQVQNPAVVNAINVGTAPGSLDVFKQFDPLQPINKIAEFRRIAPGVNTTVVYTNDSIVIDTSSAQNPAVVDIVNIGTAPGGLDIFKQMDPLQPINKIAELRRIAPGVNTTVTYFNDTIVIDAIGGGSGGVSNLADGGVAAGHQSLVANGVGPSLSNKGIVGNANNISFASTANDVYATLCDIQLNGNTTQTANASGSTAISIGRNSTASGPASTAVGAGAIAAGNQSSAIGNGCSVPASGNSSLAMGVASLSEGTASIAIGLLASASNPAKSHQIAIGRNCTSNNDSTITIGVSSQATGPQAIAMGDSTVASGSYSTSLGCFSACAGSRGTAVGIGASASTASSVAVGDLTTVTVADAIAIGRSAASSSIAIGAGSSSTGTLSIAIGNASIAAGNLGTAVGHISRASNLQSSAFGYNAIASGSSATSIGDSTSAEALRSTALGQAAHATGDHSIAIGYGAIAAGSYSVSIGRLCSATAGESIAIGRNQINTTANSMVLGIGNPMIRCDERGPSQVFQATATSDVTLSTAWGVIYVFKLNPAANVTFTLFNNRITPDSFIFVSAGIGASSGAPVCVSTSNLAMGSVRLCINNLSSGATHNVFPVYFWVLFPRSD